MKQNVATETDCQKNSYPFEQIISFFCGAVLHHGFHVGVLKPGGRLMIADQILIGELTKNRKQIIKSWFQ